MVDPEDPQDDAHQTRQVRPSRGPVDDLGRQNWAGIAPSLNRTAAMQHVANPVGAAAIRQSDDRGVGADSETIDRRSVVPSRAATHMVNNGEVGESPRHRFERMIGYTLVESGDPSRQRHWRKLQEAIVFQETAMKSPRISRNQTQ